MRRSLPELVELLSCPYCAGKLDIAGDFDNPLGTFFGILQCDCYRYGVLHDVPVLRQLSQIGSNRDPVVERLEQRDFEGAMRAAGASLLPQPPASAGPLTKIRKALGGGNDASMARDIEAAGIVEALRTRSFREALYAMKLKSYADYLYHRFANNSYMAAFVFLLLLADRLREDGDGPHRVLDVACGMGHTAHLAATLNPDIDVFAVDFDFGNLCMARNYVAPDATFICLDAEMRLPFADDFFSASLGLDGLHYLRGKVSVLNELDRVLRHDAIWLFPHLHNALQDNAAPGTPLPPGGWHRLFDFLPHRIVTEESLLADFIDRDECKLSAQVPNDVLEPVKSLAAIATRRDDFWRRYPDLAKDAAAAIEKLSLNPILEVWAADDDRVELEARWPSEDMHEECSYSVDVFENRVSVPVEAVRALREGNEAPQDDVARLVNQFVAVHVPDCYSEADA